MNKCELDDCDRERFTPSRRCYEHSSILVTKWWTVTMQSGDHPLGEVVAYLAECLPAAWIVVHGPDAAVLDAALVAAGIHAYRTATTVQYQPRRD